MQIDAEASEDAVASPVAAAAGPAAIEIDELGHRRFEIAANRREGEFAAPLRAGPSTTIPSGSQLEAYFRQVVVLLVVRGHVPTGIVEGHVWASLARMATRFAQPAARGDEMSTHVVHHRRVDHVGLDSNTKDAIVDVAPVGVWFAVAACVLAKFGVAVTIPVRVDRFEVSGTVEDYPSSVLLRGTINSYGYATSPTMLVFGANLGHRIEEFHGANAAGFGGLAIGPHEIGRGRRSPWFARMFEALELIAGEAGGTFADDFDVPDLRVLAPLVLAIDWEGKLALDPTIAGMDDVRSGPRVARLHDMIEHFVPSRHEFAMAFLARPVVDAIIANPGYHWVADFLKSSPNARWVVQHA